MAEQKFDDVMRDLRNKVYHPIYLFMGEESYFIDQLTDYISKNVLDDGEKEFNQTVVYGSDVTVPELVSIAKRFPMMSNHQVVIVKEAQKIKKLEEIASYVTQPLDSTLLVLAYKYGNLDKRKAFAKDLIKKAVVFKSAKIPDYKMADWILKYVKERGFVMNLPAAALLADYLGTDLSKITNEIDKLALVLKKGSEINQEVIQNNIGISKDFNVFELQNAIAKKDIFKANQIAQHFASNPKSHPLVMTLSSLYNYFSKLMILHYLKDKSDKNAAAELRVHPFFVKDYKQAARVYSAGKVARIVSDLREYDLKSKGFGNASTKDGELLKELLWKILH